MNTVALSIIIAASVTALIRILPILIFAARPFPKKLRYALNFMPPAVLSAITMAEIIHNNTKTSFGFSVAIGAAILSIIAGMISRSLFTCVAVSIIAFLIFQHI